MKKWICTMTTVGTLVSLSAPVYASTLSGTTSHASAVTSTSASTSMTAKTEHGFLPPE